MATALRSSGVGSRFNLGGVLIGKEQQTNRLAQVSTGGPAQFSTDGDTPPRNDGDAAIVKQLGIARSSVYRMLEPVSAAPAHGEA
jgi:hypothetical protein